MRGKKARRILLAVDDGARAERLRTLLGECDSQAGFKIESCAVDQALSCVSKHDFDLLLIDVSTRGVATAGVEAVRAMQKAATDGAPASASAHCPQVIYLATPDTYTSAIYQTEHCYLLMEPYSAAEVAAALGKAARLRAEAQPATLALRCDGSVHILAAEKIAFVESIGRKVRVTCVDGEQMETYATLADIEDQLAPAFIRCHKRYLVNASCIVRLDGAELLLTTGDVVAVSQRRLPGVREILASR
jgi:DNA-binding LytR/AlgR family response regulator